jgi:hypothetical protein
VEKVAFSIKRPYRIRMKTSRLFAVVVIIATLCGALLTSTTSLAVAKTPTCKTSKAKKTTACKKKAYQKRCAAASKRHTKSCAKEYLALYCKTSKAKKTSKCKTAKKDAANKKQVAPGEETDNNGDDEESADDDPVTVPAPAPSTKPVPDDEGDDTPVIHEDQDPVCDDSSEPWADSQGNVECYNGETPSCDDGYALGVDSKGGPICRWRGEAADGGEPDESNDVPEGYCSDGSQPRYEDDSFPTCDNGEAPVV